MKKTITATILCLFLLNGYAQNISSDADTLSYQKFVTMVNANRDQSYLTFGNGFGNLEPLIFEAKFSPSYFVTKTNRNWALTLNPQIQLRMLNQESVPVRIPSYRGYLTFYHAVDFWKQAFFRKIFYEDALWFASVAHHSNGQEGSFYVDDSTNVIDTKRGNFSTNFLQVGVASYSLRPVGADYFSIRQIKAHLEVHPPGFHVPELNGQYGFYRLFFTFGLAGPQRIVAQEWVNRWAQRSSVEVQTGWIFGDVYNAGRVDARQRLVLDITYRYYPRWLDEFAFFVRYYRGQDYYNIRFTNTLNNVSFGITSNTTKLQEAARFLGRKR